VAALVTGKPGIDGQGVDVVAMRNAKPSQVAGIVAALRGARASAVTLKTNGRDDTTQKVALAFGPTLPDCTVVAWIAKDGVIDVWPAGGGATKRVGRGLAGPDMTLAMDAIRAQWVGCGAPSIAVGADDAMSWGLVFDLATSALQAPGSRAHTMTLITTANPGKKLALPEGGRGGRDRKGAEARSWRVRDRPVVSAPGSGFGAFRWRPEGGGEQRGGGDRGDEKNVEDCVPSERVADPARDELLRHGADRPEPVDHPDREGRGLAASQVLRRRSRQQRVGPVEQRSDERHHGEVRCVARPADLGVREERRREAEERRGAQDRSRHAAQAIRESAQRHRSAYAADLERRREVTGLACAVLEHRLEVVGEPEEERIANELDEEVAASVPPDRRAERHRAALGPGAFG